MDESEETIKKEFWKSFKFFKQKKVLIALLAVLFLIILIGGIYVRIGNLSLLKDSTSGKTIPLALDPYYFLRMAETIINQGGLPEVDSMRYPAANVGFTSEILPQVLVILYKVMNIFGDFSIGFVNVISPVVFFALGLIVFFFLIYALTKSKLGALFGSAFLAFIPSYLYRTTAGFSDHEAIGMLSLFLVFLGFAYAMKFLDKKDKSWIKTTGFALLVALLTALCAGSWGGGATFIFLVIPMSFLIFWFVNYKTPEKIMFKAAMFYLVWLVFSVIFGVLFGSSMMTFLNRFILSPNGLISLFVLGVIFIDYALCYLKSDLIKRRYRQLYALGITIVLGGIGLFFIGSNPFSFIIEIWEKLLHPFGLARVGLTVAENAQPYLTDWINQTGKVLFWFFYFGMIFIGVEISRKIKTTRLSKIYFVLLWALMISGILFSRISAGSLLNGVNFISQAFYIIGLLAFGLYALRLYLKKELDINSELIIAASWMFAMIISGRAAIRQFFGLTPFVCFASAFFVIKLIEYYKISKDDLLKMVFGIATIAVILLALVNIISFAQAVAAQAKYTAPSANSQWQAAMSWVRENTAKGSIFVHWWDYGYWVQYLGERPTVTDGGHAIGYWDHLVGRYLLTTPYPETAMSFMKSHNVSYLLIDPTEIGKYPAYSSIGSNDNHDRYSAIIAMASDPKNIQETSKGEIRVYQGTYGVDEDTVIKVNDTEIFLPGPTYDKMNRPMFKSYVIGTVLEIEKFNGSSFAIFNQPQGIFLYNGNQYKIPLRYVEYNGEVYDFESGLEGGVKVVPRIFQNSQGGVQGDAIGALIYLSPRTFKGLVGQLYLLGDELDKYPDLELVHTEPSPVVSSLKARGMNGIEDFVYYQGIQGPIKIWEVEYDEDVLEHEEFLRQKGDWAEFDDLEFVK